jgi:anti-anti-sigma factor
MAIRIEHVGDVAVVILDGELKGASEVSQLDEQLRNVYDTGCRRVLFDLDRVTFLSAEGIGVMVRGHWNATEPRTLIFAVRPGTRTEDVLRVCGSRFKIFDSRDEALKALQEL